MKMSMALKALGDPIRLRLFHLLSEGKEVCVCHLVEAVQLPQSTVSRQLAILRQAELVETRRAGKWIYYRLSGSVASALAELIRHDADMVLQADLERLASARSACA